MEENKVNNEEEKELETPINDSEVSDEKSEEGAVPAAAFYGRVFCDRRLHDVYRPAVGDAVCDDVACVFL